MAGRSIVKAYIIITLCGTSGSAQYENCIDGIIEFIQNGRCDEENNNERCLYDGGDCCQCNSIEYGSFSYDSGSSFSTCVDPRSSCYSPTAAALRSNCTDGDFMDIGDGRCDEENNNERCLYDGGDCCQCNNIEYGSFSYDTGSPFSTCVDPRSSCYSPTAAALRSNCTDGNVMDIGDSRCDEENNNERCLYDGGDCCSCTCISQGSTCGQSGFKCLDPEASDLEPYICEKWHHNISECQGGIQPEWIIENATQLQNLAEAVRCSGVSFSVTWKGKIIVNKTISITDGTAINVTGIDADSVIDGDGKTRLFSVVNASLNLSNITVSNGNANYGGAIAASRSGLSFAGVSFIGNTATYDGGALHASNGTSVSFVGEIYFLNNIAFSGGAVCVTGGSNANWTAEAHFSNNSAGYNGGALFLEGSSGAHWTADAHFFNNSAGYSGGALSLWESSSAHWTAEAHFYYNNAGDFGGALLVEGSSSVQWTGEAQFFNNSAGLAGGGLFLPSKSSAQWTGEAHFVKNYAGYSGGALYLWGSSSAHWTAEALFLNNSAGDEGGALYLEESSSAHWTAEAHLFNNSAGFSGGALSLWERSSAHWTAEAHFYYNSAGDYGGALYMLSSSSAHWTGEAHFFNNSAGGDGGAMYMTSGSSASWKGAKNYSRNMSTGERSDALGGSDIIEFSGNEALSNGGAVYASDNSYLSWSAKILFINNKAENGGALFVSNSANIQWSGDTKFTSNNAKLNGGAIGIVSAINEIPFIAINGTTSFVNNTGGGSGGAMSLVNSAIITVSSKNIIFLKNSAGASGGALYTSFNRIGILFIDVAFVENVASIGGAVHSTGSGTAVTINNPMTFDGCKFVGNYAFATGGAIDSATGQDVFLNTSFEGNKARVGGALRLAGIASLDNCSFEENVSELGGGPAVSNSAYMSNVANSYFYHNIFKCRAQEFLHFNELDNPYETVCDGCPTPCFGCSFGEGQGSPTCMSLSEAGVEHATSEGGHTTVEELVIHKGYWRATNTSTNIQRCFNTKACKGGLTGGSDYCASGYEGPYCSICSKNYVSSLRFTCGECFDHTTVIATAAVLLGLALGVVIAIGSYLVSAEEAGARRGITDYMMQRIPLHSLKILIILWQILTQFTYVANVKFPSVYQRFLDGVNVLNFDLSWLLSAGCFLEVDFHDRLLWTTISPLVIMGLLGITYTIVMYRNLTSPETTIRHIQHKHMSMVLLVIILVYSSVSSVVFQMFACDDLDDGKRYLRADYSIDCDSSKHRVLQIYSGFMILLYPVGIPALYATLLFWNRTSIVGSHTLQEPPLIRSISSLWKPYKPQRFYYEVIECARRISLTGVIVFIYPNSAAQVAATFAIAVGFIFVSEGMAPYASPWDAWISRMGQAIIFASMYLALLLKVDVSGENEASQKMFEAILVACHGCMVLAVVIQIVIMALSLKVVRPLEYPRPRSRRPVNLALIIQPCVIKDADVSKNEL